MSTQVETDFRGIWPVMLTPFSSNGEVDWRSLERLVNWYIDAGVHGLFALCQSSEIFVLSDAEKLAIGRFVLQVTAGRVPVVISGHTADSLSQQSEQLLQMESLGAAAIILISNRFANEQQSDGQWLDNLQQVIEPLKPDTQLGFYECPYPYKRLLSEDALSWCVGQQRFRVIKDTCCDVDILKKRTAITAGTRLELLNANTATLLDSLRMGATGYSGVMANFHPRPYVWLYENWQTQPEVAEKLSAALSLASLAEGLNYPVCAKFYQHSIGNFSSLYTRVKPIAPFVNDPTQSRMIVQMQQLIDELEREWISKQ